MLCDAAGLPLDVTVTAFAVPGKVPLFAETGNDPGPADDGATIGLQVGAGETLLFFVPGCGAMTDALQNRLRGTAHVLFDGTLWRNDEMISAGLGGELLA
jgi:pyrroloquinoline quinone biosynthesis protein B